MNDSISLYHYLKMTLSSNSITLNVFYLVITTSANIPPEKLYKCCVPFANMKDVHWPARDRAAYKRAYLLLMYEYTDGGIAC